MFHVLFQRRAANEMEVGQGDICHMIQNKYAYHVLIVILQVVSVNGV